MSKLLAVLLATALPFVSASAPGDDKIPSPVEHGSDPYGATPARTPKGTPLVGDFDRPDRQRAVTPEEKAAAKKAKRGERVKALSTTEKQQQDSTPGQEMKGGFGPLGGWPEQKARRDTLEKERAGKKQDKSERQKALTDQSKKGAGQ